MAANPLNFTPSLTGGSSGGAAAEGAFRSGSVIQGGGGLLWPAIAAIVGVAIFFAVRRKK